MIVLTRPRRALLALGVVSAACLPLGHVAQAHADTTTHVLNAPSSSFTIDGPTPCTVTQSVAQGLATLNLRTGNIDLTGTTSSTSNCDSTLLPYLYSSVTVENLNPVAYSSASNSATGSGFGPVTAQATDSIPTALYGPQERFTFLTNATTNVGNTAHICQQITTNELLVAEYSSPC